MSAKGTVPLADRGGLSPHDRDVLPQVTRRLIPFLFICYVIAYIDRVNIGFAASAMQRDLGLSDSVYGTGAGLFFLGYFLFEIPSNLILERVGARRWMARIMIVWGLVSMATMFVEGKWSFYGMRVLLGLAEAGFFPGAILYLTYWIPQRARARNAALFMIATPVAILVGAPLSGLLMELDGALGLHGWQWLFLGEGLPAVIAGVVTLFYLTDRPEQAEWLSPQAREWLTNEMARDHAAAAHGHVTLGASFRSARVWLLSLRLLPQHERHATASSCGCPRFWKTRQASRDSARPADDDPVRVHAGCDGDRGPPFGSDGRAQAARRRLRAGRRLRSRAGVGVWVERAAAARELHALPVGAAIDSAGVLDAAAAVAGRHRRGRRVRADQRGRQSRRLRRPVDDGMVEANHRRLRPGDARPRRRARRSSRQSSLRCAFRASRPN